MDPSTRKVSDFLLGANPLVIPPYQRAYEWGEDRWTDLWRDIAVLYARESRSRSRAFEMRGPSHFLGTTIVKLGRFLGGLYGSEVIIVDGQQRLITLFVLSAAIRDHGRHLVGKAPTGEPLAHLGGSDRPRLSPNAVNSSAFTAIVQGECTEAIPDHLVNSRLGNAYRFFRYQLWRGMAAITDFEVRRPPRPSRSRNAPSSGSYIPWGTPARERAQIDLEFLDFIVKSGLSLLQIQLEPNDEDAGVIFDTINGKTTPLRQFDHLRNSIFIRMPNRSERFLSEMWGDVESTLASVSYSSLRSPSQDQFLYEYLLSLGEDSVTMKNLHRVFMERAIRGIGYEVTTTSERGFERKFARPLAVSALLYPLAVGNRDSIRIGSVNHQLPSDVIRSISENMAISGGPPVPLHLRYLRSWQEGELPPDALRNRIILVQSFLVRTLLAGRSFSPLRSTFMSIARSLEDDSEKALISALHEHGWPSDEEVLDSVASTQLTSRFPSGAVAPVLRGIERALSGRGAHPLEFGTGLGRYSVEHIFPQGSDPGRQWRRDLTAWGGEGELERTMEVVHTLGNLTAVTNWDNSRYGRRPFDEKKQLMRPTAPLKLHDTFRRRRRWTQKEITARSQQLARAALKEWPLRR